MGSPPGAHRLARPPGFEIGQAYQAGSGAMAGDFYDVFKVDTIELPP